MLINLISHLPSAWSMWAQQQKCKLCMSLMHGILLLMVYWRLGFVSSWEIEYLNIVFLLLFFSGMIYASNQWPLLLFHENKYKGGGGNGIHDMSEHLYNYGFLIANNLRKTSWFFFYRMWKVAHIRKCNCSTFFGSEVNIIFFNAKKCKHWWFIHQDK